MRVQCVSFDAPLAYFVCAGIKDAETRALRLSPPARVCVYAAGRYGEVHEWMLCDELPLDVYNDFVDLISNRNPTMRGRFWEIGEDGKARIRSDVELDESGRLQRRFVELLRRRAHDGHPLWVSESLVGEVTFLGSSVLNRSPWAQAASDAPTWVLTDALLWEQPLRTRRRRGDSFHVELPDDCLPKGFIGRLSRN